MKEQYPKEYLYRRIVQAKLFIDKNYDQQIVIDDITEEAFFSKFHFIRLFKQTYGKTPHQYLSFVRIEKAKQLLQNQSVAKVYQQVGFQTLSAFGSLFKRLTGSTPSAYFEIHSQLMIKRTESPLSFVPGCIVYQHGLD